MAENKTNFNIRLLKKGDTENYFQLIDNNRERLKRYFPVTVSEILNLEECTYYVAKKIKQAKKRKLFLFVIFEKKKMIGVLIVKNIDWRIPKAELAYFIDGGYEGQGIMSEAMKKLIKHCFHKLEMHKLYICVSPKNKPSQRLAVKSGFLLEGVHRQEFRIETGELEDIEYYGRLKGD